MEYKSCTSRQREVSCSARAPKEETKFCFALLYLAEERPERYVSTEIL